MRKAGEQGNVPRWAPRAMEGAGNRWAMGLRAGSDTGEAN